MSSLFDLDYDGFRYVLSWLDVGCICKLDIAVGNVDERLLWLHSLHTMDSKAVDKHEHSHTSLRWLISRGARAAGIRTKGANLKSDRITDQTFTGIGLFHVQNVDTGGADCVLNGSVVRHTLQSREIKAVTNKFVSVGARSCRHLISINLTGCQSISDIGISAIAEGCHHLTSINLRYCNISDIGISAIAEGCHGLISVGLSGSITDIGISAIAEGCHHLTSIDLSCCQSISDIGISAIAEGCHHLTNIAVRGCGKISKKCSSALRRSYPRLQLDHLRVIDE